MHFETNPLKTDCNESHKQCPILRFLFIQCPTSSVRLSFQSRPVQNRVTVLSQELFLSRVKVFTYEITTREWSPEMDFGLFFWAITVFQRRYQCRRTAPNRTRKDFWSEVFNQKVFHFLWNVCNSTEKIRHLSLGKMTDILKWVFSECSLLSLLQGS